MFDADYLQNLATRCRRLARSCFDLGVAGELREMAADLERKAAEAVGPNAGRGEAAEKRVQRRG
jgi:hypothetical protein